MRDDEGKQKRKRPGPQPAEASQDYPAVSYTPEQRRLIRKGLRIWARVAVRSYMRKHAAGSQAEGGGEVEGQLAPFRLSTKTNGGCTS